jgi:hypothetical protein
MRFTATALVLSASLASIHAQQTPLKTTAEVLDRYQHALGGADAIARVQSQTIRGEVEGSGVTFVSMPSLSRR